MNEAPGAMIVPSGMLTSATYSARLHGTMLPDPGAGAVGGAFVTSGVGDLTPVGVCHLAVAVGVCSDRCVSCAATVWATDVAMSASFVPAGAQLAIRAAATTSEASVSEGFLFQSFLLPFEQTSIIPVRKSAYCGGRLQGAS